MRQMIANRNVNIWDTIVVDLLAVKSAGSLSSRRGTRSGTGKFGTAESGKIRFKL